MKRAIDEINKRVAELDVTIEKLNTMLETESILVKKLRVNIRKSELLKLKAVFENYFD